jgi:hypothetical protein
VSEIPVRFVECLRYPCALKTRGFAMVGGVEATPEGLAKFIVTRTKEHWEKFKQPYLLAYIPAELQPREIKYKEILGPGKTLKQFAALLQDGSLSDELKVIIHPTQKAKVGLIPKTSNFVFEVEPTVGPGPKSQDRPKKPRQPSQRFIVLQFLAALSRLSDEDLKTVNIPVNVLAKLMGDREL